MIFFWYLHPMNHDYLGTCHSEYLKEKRCKSHGVYYSPLSKRNVGPIPMDSVSKAVKNDTPLAYMRKYSKNP